MKARGRYVWQNKQTGHWMYEARVISNYGQCIKKQRRAASKNEAETKVELLYQELLISTSSVVQTFVAVLTEYSKFKEAYVRESTLANNLYLLEKYVLPQIGERKIHEISPRELAVLFDKLSKSKLKVGTLNKVRAVLHAVFSYAVDFRYLDSNPMKPIKAFKAAPGSETQVQVPWSLSEAQQALKLSNGTTLDFFIHATLTYGLRKGEVLALKWSDIDFDSGEIRIRRSRSFGRRLHPSSPNSANSAGELKTQAARRDLALTSPVALSLLRERERQQELGFSTEADDFIVRGPSGGPLCDSTLRRDYNAFCASNGLRRIRIHDHRHTAAVLALESGASPIETSYGLGHSSFEITKRIYAAQVPKLARAFSEKLSDALWSMPETPGAEREGVGK